MVLGQEKLGKGILTVIAACIIGVLCASVGIVIQTQSSVEAESRQAASRVYTLHVYHYQVKTPAQLMREERESRLAEIYGP